VDVWPTPASFYAFWDVRQAFGRTTLQGRVLRTSDDMSAYLIEEGGVVNASGSRFMAGRPPAPLVCDAGGDDQGRNARGA
jgi:aspartate aminotransferase